MLYIGAKLSELAVVTGATRDRNLLFQRGDNTTQNKPPSTLFQNFLSKPEHIREPTEELLTCRQYNFKLPPPELPSNPQNTTFSPFSTQTIPAVTPQVI
jgi:hypothetical protein